LVYTRVPHTNARSACASCHVVAQHGTREDDYAVWVMLYEHATVALQDGDFLVPEPVTSTNFNAKAYAGRPLARQLLRARCAAVYHCSDGFVPVRAIHRAPDRNPVCDHAATNNHNNQVAVLCFARSHVVGLIRTLHYCIFIQTLV
jgi:hypothetical protein